MQTGKFGIVSQVVGSLFLLGSVVVNTAGAAERIRSSKALFTLRRA